MKRFTESEKWKNRWFRRLSLAQKCLWSYICDNCDQAGVIDIDFDLASFQIGSKVTPKDIEAFGKRIIQLDGEKYWIRSFVQFQYGKLSEACKPHMPVFAALAKHGIDLSMVEQNACSSESISSDVKARLSDRLSKPIQKPLNDSPIASERLQEKEEEKDKDKEEDNQGSAEGGQASPPPPTIEDIYVAYPRKQGKADALNAIAKALKRGVSAERLLERTHAYATATDAWPEDDRRYIPHPATWFNRGSYDDDPGAWVRFDPSKPKPTPVADLPDNVREFLALRDGNANA